MMTGAPVPGATRTALVVDEDPRVRALIEIPLRARGVRVLSAASAAEAIEQIERERPDLVLCDVYMPDTSGYRVCDFVKRHPILGATPVVLMADTVDGAVLTRAAQAGSAGVARRPVAADDVLGQIDGLLPAAPAVDVPLLDGGGAPDDSDALVATLNAHPGVSLVAQLDREGFVLGPVDEAAGQGELVSALTACLAESSETIGRELGRGSLRSMVLEYGDGCVLLSQEVAPGSRLAVLLSDPAALWPIRQALAAVAPAS